MDPLRTVAFRLALEEDCTVVVSFGEADALLELCQGDRLVHEATITSSGGMDLAILVVAALIVAPHRNRPQWFDRVRSGLRSVQTHLQGVEKARAAKAPTKPRARRARPSKRSGR